MKPNPYRTVRPVASDGGKRLTRPDERTKVPAVLPLSTRRFSTRRCAAFCLGLCLSLAVLVGCKNDAPQQKTNAAPTSSAIPDDFVINSFFGSADAGIAVKYDGSAGIGAGPEATAGADTKTKVLDPGADPRTKLAYAPVLGKTTTVLATITAEMMGEGVPPEQAKQPPIRFTLAVTPKKKLDAGKTQVEIKIPKIELAPGEKIPAEAQKQMATLEATFAKVTGTFSLSANGETTDLDFNSESLPRGAFEQFLGLVARAYDLLFIPLPGAPIGVGAKWVTSSSQAEQAVSVDTTFTLLSKTDNALELKVETLRLAAPRAVRDPRSNQKMMVEIKGGGTFNLGMSLDALTTKASGETVTNIVTNVEGKKTTAGEKVGVTIEKSGK